MRVFKYSVWIAVLFLVQTVLINDIRIYSMCPDIILPFVIVSAIKEDSFKLSTAVGIVCAVISGALCGKNFYFAVLFYTYTSALVFNLRRHPRYMPDFVRYILWVFFASLVSEIISYLILYMSFDWFLKAFILYMLPSALYTLAASLVIYPLANAALYKSNVKRTLI